MSTGQLIKAARKARNMTQKQLAEKLNVSYVNISQLENNQRIPGVDTIQRIATALGVGVHELIPAANQEPDWDFEMVLDTLADAGISIEPVGLGDGTDADGDLYYVWHNDAEDPAEDSVMYTFRDLFRITTEVRKAAELKKRDYIRKRMEADLF